MTSMTCPKVRGLHHGAGPHLGGEKQRNQVPGEQEVPRGGGRPHPGEYRRRGATSDSRVGGKPFHIETKPPNL